MTAEKVRVRKSKITGNPRPQVDLFTGESFDLIHPVPKSSLLGIVFEHPFPLSLEQLLKVGAEICEGLEKAHRSGVVHRDLSVLQAWHSQTWLGWPSSSHVSPKKDQSRPRCGTKYFCLRQRVFLFGCLRRAHRHRLEKIS